MDREGGQRETESSRPKRKLLYVGAAYGLVPIGPTVSWLH